MLSALRTLAVLLLFPTLLLAAETPVGDIVYGNAPGQKSHPAIASNGDGYLAVWFDSRDGRGALLATRISGSGEVLDPTGLRLTSNGGETPSVVWSGTKWLVFYRTNTNSFYRTWVVSVTRDGELSEARLVANHATGGSAVSNGSRVVLPYYALPPGAFNTEIRAAILTTDGEVVDDIRLADSSNNRSGPSIATNGSEFLVAWNAFVNPPTASVEVVRLDARGTLIDAQPRVLYDAYNPIIASDGRDFLIGSRIAEQGGLRWAVTPVSRDLAVGLAVPVPGGEFMHQTSLVWTGSQYVFLGQYNPPIGGGYFLTASAHDRNGRTTATEPARVRTLDIASLDPQTVVATNGRELVALSIFSEQRAVSQLNSAVATFIDPATLRESRPSRLLSVSANRQANAAVASSGFDSLVVWTEESGIYAARVRPDGTTPDGRGIHLSDSETTGLPVVIHDGRQYVVAWSDYRDAVTVRFIAATGLLPEILRIDVQAGPAVALASGGETTLLAWRDLNYRLRTIRIQRDTRSFDGAAVYVTPPSVKADQPALAWNGTEFLLAWSELELQNGWQFPFYLAMRIRGTRLSPGLTVRDTGTLLIGDTPDGDRAATIASDGTDWLVVWSSDSGNRGRRVLRDGTLPGDATGALLGTGGMAALAWDGTRYLAAWKSDDRVVATLIPRTGPLSPAGVVVLSRNDSTQTRVSLSTRGETVLAAYARLEREARFGHVDRLVLRPVEWAPRMRAVR